MYLSVPGQRKNYRGQNSAIGQYLHGRLCTFLILYQTLDPVSSGTTFADFSRFWLGSHKHQCQEPEENKDNKFCSCNFEG